MWWVDGQGAEWMQGKYCSCLDKKWVPLGPELCQGVEMTISWMLISWHKRESQPGQSGVVHIEISKEAKLKPQNYIDGMNCKCTKVPESTIVKICFC